MDSDNFIVNFVLYILIVVLACFGIYYSSKSLEHIEYHDECGYESIQVIQTTNIFGDPGFYRVVRYKDGCEKTIRISGAEYFEEVNKESE